LFEKSKTVRGVLLSILLTTAGAPVLGLDLATGARVAIAAMAGDLLSSFVKRRLDLPPSSQAVGLDQIPESLFSHAGMPGALSVTIADIALGVGVFFVGELILSRL
jgi:hypothetical protein